MNKLEKCIVTDERQKKQFISMYKNHSKVYDFPITEEFMYSLWNIESFEKFLYIDSMGNAVGFCVCSLLYNGTCYIEEFYIRPEYRRMGYGMEFAHEINNYYKSDIFFMVMKSNKVAKIFWENTFKDMRRITEIKPAFISVLEDENCESYYFVQNEQIRLVG